MIELFQAAPGPMTVIAMLLLGLIGSGVYGVLHSRYSRRLVLGTVIALTVLVLIVAAVAWVSITFFPVPPL